MAFTKVVFMEPSNRTDTVDFTMVTVLPHIEVLLTLTEGDMDHIIMVAGDQLCMNMQTHSIQ